MSKILEYTLVIATFLLALNVLFINYVVLSRSKSETTKQVIFSENYLEPCNELCQKQIVERVLKNIPTSVQKQTVVEKQSVESKEYFIPLGNGKTASKEWSEIPGVEANINTFRYPKIKKVVFEVHLSIPTANGYTHAKLFNVTDKHDVWFSEVSMETNTVTRKEAEITLEPGEKLYRVMMKSTLGYEAVLTNAKIKIITE